MGIGENPVPERSRRAGVGRERPLYLSDDMVYSYNNILVYWYIRIMNSSKPVAINKSTRNVVIAFALLCGLSGIIAGVFEIVQGNHPTDGLIISTIGPDFEMWKSYTPSQLMDTYSALTLIPNFLVTGILAIMASLMVILWSIFRIHKKSGPLVFLILSLLQFILGGSFVLDLATITFLVALTIGKPLNWWNRLMPDRIKRIFAAFLPYAILLFALTSLILLLITIFGANNEELHRYMNTVAAFMFIPIILMIPGGFARDLLKRQQ